MSKYGAKKVTIDGITFDSKADGRVEVVDIKGFPTPEFKIKAKMFMFRYQVPLVLLKWSTATKKFVEV